MRANRPVTPSQRGQMIVLMALVLTVCVLMVGLVIDGGTALAQRRAAQNASDFAALAGARIVAESIGGDAVNGTDGNVKLAIANGVASNGGTAVVFGPPNGPRYVDASGSLLGFVDGGSIPAAAVGVKVSSTRTWSPYFLGIIGFKSWAAAADATAKGGYSAGGPGGNVFPVGIAESFFKTYPFCSGKVSSDPTSPCYPQHLTPGNLNVPGGFGWLKFGCDGRRTPGAVATRSRSLRARSDRRPIATAAAPPSNCRAVPTGSGTCRATRSRPTARTTSTTASR